MHIFFFLISFLFYLRVSFIPLQTSVRWRFQLFPAKGTKYKSVQMKEMITSRLLLPFLIRNSEPFFKRPHLDRLANEEWEWGREREDMERKEDRRWKRRGRNHQSETTPGPFLASLVYCLSSFSRNSTSRIFNAHIKFKRKSWKTSMNYLCFLFWYQLKRPTVQNVMKETTGQRAWSR